uniref:B box-type domain-containing protein n=1 Tax=Glossina palpalis gambiensis TaxID=67801 RepID=A0A1B0BH34_9MUSC
MLSNVQNNKLFDDKFLANTLRNCRRCPRCRSEYSFAFDKRMGDTNIRSHRPFLLTCGHNMCENCVIHNRQKLECGACLKPIPIPQSQTTINFRIRQIFDMNFFVMGELNHLKFYRKDGSFNNTLVASADNMGYTAPQCAECDSAVATGKCRQCRVSMCKRCFDSVHKNSKTLQKHLFVPLDAIRGQHNQLPKPKHCKRHNRSSDYYCRMCDVTCCYECARTDHNNHSFCPLIEENKKLMEELASVMENVKLYRDSVQNAQKLKRFIDSSPWDNVMRVMMLMMIVMAVTMVPINDVLIVGVVVCDNSDHQVAKLFAHQIHGINFVPVL